MSLIVLIGVTGSGKSTVARELSERYGLALHETDAAVEARLGASMHSLIVQRDPRLPDTAREEADRLLSLDEGIVTLGASQPLDPATASSIERARKRRDRRRAERRSFRSIAPRRPRGPSLRWPWCTPRCAHPADEASTGGIRLRGRCNSRYE